MITASLRNYRITPRKVRLVVNMVRGKKVIEAKTILAHALKKAGEPISDLIDSAVANAAHNFKLDKDALYIKEIRVDQGYVLKRSIPMSRGSAFPMKKRTSHVKITLAPSPVKGSAKKVESKTEEKKEVKKIEKKTAKK